MRSKKNFPHLGQILKRVNRGNNGVSYLNRNTVTNTNTSRGWRPSPAAFLKFVVRSLWLWL